MSNARDPRASGSINGLIADILVIFSPAFDLFLRIPPFFKITEISGVCPHSGGNIFRRGTARRKMNKYLRPSQGIVFPQKKGHSNDYYLWNSRKIRKKTVVGGI